MCRRCATAARDLLRNAGLPGQAFGRVHRALHAAHVYGKAERDAEVRAERLATAVQEARA